MAIFYGFTRSQFELLVETLFSFTDSHNGNRERDKLESERQTTMADPHPDLEAGTLSERCRLVRAAQRDSWPWPVDPTKVLVLLITWLGAKDRHILKYSDLYAKQGLDVLVVKSKARECLWPRNSFALAEDIFNVLENETELQGYDHIISHSMSVGCFNWTVLRMLLKQREDTEHISCKFKGQLLDSMVAGEGKCGVFDEPPVAGQQEVHGLDRMVHGIVVAKISNPVMQRVIKLGCKAYFSLTKNSTVKFYEDALTFFREEPLRVPTLFLTSRDDPMSDATVLEKLVNFWKEEQQVQVSLQVWDSSPHAQHYMRHKEEYESLNRELIKEIFSNKDSTDPGVNGMRAGNQICNDQLSNDGSILLDLSEPE